jgi:hypothetical protein
MRPGERWQRRDVKQHLRTSRDERRPGLHRDREHLPIIRRAEEKFPAVARPERTPSAARRNLLPIAQLRIPPPLTGVRAVPRGT